MHRKKKNMQDLFYQFIECNNLMQSPTLFQNIFKFCTILHKFLNILTFFVLLKIVLPFFCKIGCIPLLSRIGPMQELYAGPI